MKEWIKFKNKKEVFDYVLDGNYIICGIHCIGYDKKERVYKWSFCNSVEVSSLDIKDVKRFIELTRCDAIIGTGEKEWFRYTELFNDPNEGIRCKCYTAITDSTYTIETIVKHLPNNAFPFKTKNGTYYRFCTPEIDL